MSASFADLDWGASANDPTDEQVQEAQRLIGLINHYREKTLKDLDPDEVVTVLQAVMAAWRRAKRASSPKEFEEKFFDDSPNQETSDNPASKNRLALGSGQGDSSEGDLLLAMLNKNGVSPDDMNTIRFFERALNLSEGERRFLDRTNVPDGDKRKIVVTPQGDDTRVAELEKSQKTLLDALFKLIKELNVPIVDKESLADTAERAVQELRNIMAEGDKAQQQLESERDPNVKGSLAQRLAAAKEELDKLRKQPTQPNYTQTDTMVSKSDVQPHVTAIADAVNSGRTGRLNDRLTISDPEKVATMKTALDELEKLVH